mgnify:CR=1 FL=1
MKTEKRYLAVVRTNLDELPIGLYPTKKAAREALRSVTDRRIRKIADLMKVDRAGVVIGGIVSFEDGNPTRLDLVELPRRVRG